jgi:hypothetical protein
MTAARISQTSIMHKQLKMAYVIDTHMNQTVVIKFLTAEEVNPIEIHRYLNSVYGEHTIDVSTAKLGQAF